MSDLISKQALLKEFDNYNQGNALAAVWRLRQIITNAKAIEQGEAVAYLYRCQHKQPNPKYTEWVCVSDNAHWPVDQWQSYEVLPLFTTPQQPQSVADALEEAAKLLYSQITWSDDSDEKTAIINETLLEAVRQIRALIKPNAEKVE